VEVVYQIVLRKMPLTDWEHYGTGLQVVIRRRIKNHQSLKIRKRIENKDE
jgi:hypothetical protein